MLCRGKATRFVPLFSVLESWVFSIHKMKTVGSKPLDVHCSLGSLSFFFHLVIPHPPTSGLLLLEEVLGSGDRFNGKLHLEEDAVMRSCGRLVILCELKAVSGVECQSLPDIILGQLSFSHETKSLSSKALLIMHIHQMLDGLGRKAEDPCWGSPTSLGFFLSSASIAGPG